MSARKTASWETATSPWSATSRWWILVLGSEDLFTNMGGGGWGGRVKGRGSLGMIAEKSDFIIKK